MKTMSDYSILCTEEQTCKSLELGAPIQYETYCINGISHKVTNSSGKDVIIIPTAEQMCGWLRKEKNIFFTPKKVGDNNYVLIGDLKHFQTYDSYEEAILAGIDIALEYLSNK